MTSTPSTPPNDGPIVLFPESSILTVTELTTRLRHTLEDQFPDVWVEGEISNIRQPPSGHVYFTLKDQESQIRAVLFRGIGQQIRFALEDGQQVIVRGRLTIYPPRGDYQLILASLELKGRGALQVAFEQLKAKFEREGLFDMDRKRPLPFLPRTVVLVTSPTGAAVRDMVTILRRRCPLIRIIVCPVPVQGEVAADQIAKSLAAVNRRRGVDVLIVGRGGGSQEDLWCFNEEKVVRAIAESKIPVVSAIGHETDYTLADLVADYRAPTPSAAAEIVAPLLDELVERVSRLQDRLIRCVQQQLVLFRQRVLVAWRSLPDPLLWFSRRAQRLDDLEHRLEVAIRQILMKLRPHVLTLQSSLHVHSPRSRIRQEAMNLSHYTDRLTQGMYGLLTAQRQRFTTQLTALHNLNPLAVLSRGYSIVSTVPGGKIIRNAEEVRPGDQVQARLAVGELVCVVRTVRGE